MIYDNLVKAFIPIIIWTIIIVGAIIIAIIEVIKFSGTGKKDNKNSEDKPTIPLQFQQQQELKQQQIPQLQQNNFVYLPYYLMDSVMTYHEAILFSILGDFCRKYNFVLLSKVRLADFIQPIHQNNRRNFYYWFNRISAKHVDFLVCDPKTIKPLCAIELDDYTHRYQNRQDRDHFVDNVYRSIQLPILHITEIRELYVYRNLAEILHVQLETTQ